VRIVLVTTSYPTRAGDPSGHFVRAHARELAATTGAEVRVVALGTQVPSEERAGAGRVVVEACGGGDLFAWPGAATRVAERPLRLLVAAPAL
jgi:hypothetical protein